MLAKRKKREAEMTEMRGDQGASGTIRIRAKVNESQQVQAECAIQRVRVSSSVLSA
jgi:hypothetical protein